jgi:putative two-component system response regulator
VRLRFADKMRMERVLVVDDEKDCRFALADALAAKGFDPDTAENGRTALKRLESRPSTYGLIYTDLEMPEVGGLQLVEQVATIDPTIVSVMLTGVVNTSTTLAALRAGAYDFLAKPYTSTELEFSLARAIERRKLLLKNEEYRVRLEQLINDREKEIRWATMHHQEEMRNMYISSIQAHARSIEAKDVYTAGHCDRVDRYSELLARLHGGFDEQWIFNLKVGSILHDIGKIGVRGAILSKPAKLDPQERAEMCAHPAIGGRIVRTLYGMNLEPMVRHHHERYDGCGYPDGLKGEAIPLEARIILIADTFDAMTSDRPYRKALPTEIAMAELQKHAGSQFDPNLVEIAVEYAAEFDVARTEMLSRRQGDYFDARSRYAKMIM